MSNFDIIDIYQKSSNKSKLTIKDLNGEYKKSPVIYIQSNTYLRINGTLLTVDATSYDISDMKIFEVVRLLVSLGINAQASNIKYSMYPACLLSDFESETIRIEYITKSPQEIFEYGLSYPEAIYDINQSVQFNILELYDENNTYQSELKNMKIFGQVHTTTKIMYKEIYSAYLLNVQSSKAINSHNLSSTDSAINLYTIAKASNNDI